VIRVCCGFPYDDDPEDAKRQRSVLLASHVNVALVQAGQTEFGPATKRLGDVEDALLASARGPVSIDDPMLIAQALRRARRGERMSSMRLPSLAFGTSSPI